MKPTEIKYCNSTIKRVRVRDYTDFPRSCCIHAPYNIRTNYKWAGQLRNIAERSENKSLDGLFRDKRTKYISETLQRQRFWDRHHTVAKRKQLLEEKKLLKAKEAEEACYAKIREMLSITPKKKPNKPVSLKGKPRLKGKYIRETMQQRAQRRRKEAMAKLSPEDAKEYLRQRNMAYARLTKFRKKKLAYK